MTKYAVGEGMEYSNDYANSFSDESFGKKIPGRGALHADGTTPAGYTKDGDLVYNKNGFNVWGSTTYSSQSKAWDVCLYKGAFESTEKLLLIMGHEYLHASLASINLRDDNTQHSTIRRWMQANQWNHLRNILSPPDSPYNPAYNYEQFKIYKTTKPW